METMYEIGCYSSGGMGISPLGWPDIQAWMQATGRAGAWLASTVRRLSCEYVDEHYAATDPNRPSPLSGESFLESARAATLEKMKRALKVCS